MFGKENKQRKGHKLTQKQINFINEYLISGNITEALKKAGYSSKNANNNISQVMNNPLVKAEIERRRAELSEKSGIDQEWVLEQYRKIATANANDLTQLRRIPCRYCYGENHHYQWRNEDELEEARTRALLDGVDENNLPTNKGGFGYTRKKDPHPDCPRCDGFGLDFIMLNDSRKLGEVSAALFGGVKQTREGIEMKINDPIRALEAIARHLGFFKDKLDVEVGASVTPEVLEKLANIGNQSLKESEKLNDRIKHRKNKQD